MPRKSFVNVDTFVKQQLNGQSSTPNVDVRLIESLKSSIPIEESMKTLDDVLPAYYEYNTLKTSLEKHLKEWNSRIKTSMGDQKISNYSFGGYTANITTTERYSFVEDLLILKLRELEQTEGLDVSRFIKTKEYVDMDELERAIYAKELIASEFQSCQMLNTTQTLRVKKEKKKDGEKKDGE